MSMQLIKLIKINNLQYNAQRDPQVYRGVAGEPLPIHVVIAGTGEARVALADEKGVMLAEGRVQAPGTFSHELTFAKPGVRIVVVTAQDGARSQTVNLRLDVMAHAWVG